MGAYLYYKVAEMQDLGRANKFLMQNSINDMLFELDEQDVTLIDDEQIKFAKENGGLVSYYEKRKGSGTIQMCYPSDKSIKKGYAQEDIIEFYTQVFEELNCHVKMKYLAYSCAFNPDYYFNIDQIRRITNDGELLSGASSNNKDILNAYNRLIGQIKRDNEVTDKVLLLDLLLDCKVWALKNGYIILEADIDDDTHRHYSLTSKSKELDWLRKAERLKLSLIKHEETAVNNKWLKKSNSSIRVTGSAILHFDSLLYDEKKIVVPANNIAWDNETLEVFSSGKLFA